MKRPTRSIEGHVAGHSRQGYKGSQEPQYFRGRDAENYVPGEVVAAAIRFDLRRLVAAPSSLGVTRAVDLRGASRSPRTHLRGSGPFPSEEPCVLQALPGPTRGRGFFFGDVLIPARALQAS